MPIYPAGAGVNRLFRQNWLNRLAGVTLVSYAERILALTPAGFWKLDGNPPTADSSGNARTLTVENNVVTEAIAPPTLVGATNSATFDGVNDSLFAADHNDWSSTSITVGGWFKADGLTTLQDLISKGSVGAGYEWALQISATGKPIFLIGASGGGTHRSFTGTASIPDTNWHFYVATYNNTSAPIVYIDGVAVAGTAAGPTGTRVGNFTNPLSIGLDSSNTNDFAGNAYGVFYLTTVMTPSQVSDIYTADIA